MALPELYLKPYDTQKLVNVRPTLSREYKTQRNIVKSHGKLELKYIFKMYYHVLSLLLLLICTSTFPAMILTVNISRDDGDNVML